MQEFVVHIYQLKTNKSDIVFVEQTLLYQFTYKTNESNMLLGFKRSKKEKFFKWKL